MDPSKKINSPSRIKAEKTESLTIMVIGDVGRIMSFKVSRRIILAAVVFLLLYIPSSVYLINGYLGLRHAYRTNAAALDEKSSEISEIKQDLLRAEHYTQLLNDYIQDMQRPAVPDRETSASPGEGAASRPVKSAGEEDTSPAAEAGQPAEYGDSVMIEDIAINIEGSLMTVGFKLLNTQADENTVGGYVHIVAESSGNGSPRLWVYPKETLKEGVPANFKRGELFYIKRFKQITGKIDLGPDMVRPDSIKVMVYSQSGALIFEKDYDVSNVS